MTSTIQSRQPAYWIYYVSTAVLGGAAMAYSCYQVFRIGADYRWLMLTALTLITASFTLKIPGTGSKISIADTFVLITMVFFGPAAGCLTAALEALAGSMRGSTSARRWKFALYNTSNVALCAYLSGLLYFLVLGRDPLYQDPGVSLAGLFPAAALLALAYYLLNSVTVAAIVALESGKSIFRFWLDHFVWHSINYFACTFGAVLIAVHSRSITPFHLAAAGLVVTIIYCAYRNVLGKLALNGGR
jgi:hypothetical protein